MAYLLDTDTFVYVMKKIQSARKKFESYDWSELFVASISIAELEYGIVKSLQIEKNTKSLNGFLTLVNVINFDITAASHYGLIRNFLEKKGTPIGSNDMLIAAIATCNDFILVTNNEREFRRVEGLKIENWLKD
ncbi:MAG: PIN domain-containing protein [Cyclobacteriaceae bacterium]